MTTTTPHPAVLPTDALAAGRAGAARRSMRTRLARVARALAQWDARETNARRQPAARRAVLRPVVTRAALEDRHARLTAALRPAAVEDGPPDAPGAP